MTKNIPLFLLKIIILTAIKIADYCRNVLTKRHDHTHLGDKCTSLCRWDRKYQPDHWHWLQDYLLWPYQDRQLLLCRTDSQFHPGSCSSRLDMVHTYLPMLYAGHQACHHSLGDTWSAQWLLKMQTNIINQYMTQFSSSYSLVTWIVNS